MFELKKLIFVVVASLIGVLTSLSAAAQTTEPKTEYLMTFMALLEPPAVVDKSRLIVNTRPGGWAKGPKIQGSFVSPGGDWLEVLPSGALRMDARVTLKTDDGAIIYVRYGGTIQQSNESAERLQKGETMTTKDIPYFITAPTFQTSVEKYAWLNGVQAIGKLVELKPGESIKYDVFVVR